MYTVLRRCSIVPVIVIDSEDSAEPLADALLAGGIGCAEITFRTAAGQRAIRRIADRDDFVVGAGTVVNADQVDRAVEAGARFVVSPGLGLDVVERAQQHGVAVFPGVASATEVQAAISAGLSAVKLFPAEQLGGLALINALAGPFPDMRFFPSGGIRPETARDYLDHPAVFAVGASWIVPRADIAAGRFDRVEKLTRAAVTAMASPARLPRTPHAAQQETPDAR
ncbi:bifunctional 4-hydroxy-2-oxoglutarate aldolase/2-dehydro-3-deoxy-phosphogluconate aldolase [Streptomyces cucumeris]|uniref:bifunctional 4-hydroxy-2-oxoglutarate aldolase/2-dehydro-3-deoxy-phosphogluconate aldolase n=1 Tax=Streptomyces cucumeris TaxID=2962890 RepID=UPI0020C8B419|nr:bifunctional 4-hydroxy-2-oxoglutarate aldolase/2-dehydro-3-deoxy-phosphogluconate aldolase [Streptomyces sp. NEAU-Y11]MCP9213447.1 bifunctional 4-hydroxy-2-oxoglutarate aldolase/2-dehydro-3-deoxy-phosphogluconate aldolase [Streptomyces sp. NEAU-Y11]